MVAVSLFAAWACAPAMRSARHSDYTPASVQGDEPPANGVWVESVGLAAMYQRRGRPLAGAVPGGRDGPRPITLGGVVYPRGIGTQSISEFVIDVKGQATRFVSVVGLDDSATQPEASVNFVVWGDNRRLFATDTIRPGDAPRFVSLDLTGVRILTLLMDDGGDTSNGDLGAWAGAAIIMAPGAPERPEPYDVPSDPDLPIASGYGPEPRIHGPLATGATPGRPFLYRIPATGQRPFTYGATNLPAGLQVDAATGIISGTIAARGRTVATLTVAGTQGTATRDLTIVAGDHMLARTPPLGWNSWNAWGRLVDDARVRAAADAMVSSGLADHGYDHIVIDDGWQGQRDANGVLQPNEKFPDMAALAAYVHSLGLKFGIYSSPGPTTCLGLPGSYQYELLDARTWAEWGVDYLKHDYCGYDRVAADRSAAEIRKPYDVMRRALDQVDRDIIYSIGTYGWGNVWEWGRSAGGNLWRTTGDLENAWTNLESVGFRQAGRESFAGPGHWNDPDMLIVGHLSWGRGELVPTALTRNQQILHLTLWAIQAAPLMLGADLSQLDPWTVDLLTNDEVLGVVLDTLGVAGGRVWQDERLEVWARPLHDGTWAAGLFNRGLVPAEITVRWTDLGLQGRLAVRDLWRKADLGEFADGYTVTVPRRGAVMVRVGTPGGR